MNIIIEVGANRGTDTKRFVDNPNNFVYAFEPTPELFNELKDNFKNFNNIKLFPYAIDTTEGEGIFNIAGTGDWGCSSLHEFNEEIHSLWENRPDFKFTDKCVVTKKRLDNIIIEENIERIDYLWIDAQGNDLKVLQSLGDMIYMVNEGKCEGSYTVNLYKNVDNSVDNIVKFLESFNFKCNVIPDNVGKEADVHFKRL